MCLLLNGFAWLVLIGKNVFMVVILAEPTSNPVDSVYFSCINTEYLHFLSFCVLSPQEDFIHEYKIKPVILGIDAATEA